MFSYIVGEPERMHDVESVHSESGGEETTSNEEVEQLRTEVEKLKSDLVWTKNFAHTVIDHIEYQIEDYRSLAIVAWSSMTIIYIANYFFSPTGMIALWFISSAALLACTNFEMAVGKMYRGTSPGTFRRYLNQSIHYVSLSDRFE